MIKVTLIEVQMIKVISVEVQTEVCFCCPPETLVGFCDVVLLHQPALPEMGLVCIVFLIF